MTTPPKTIVLPDESEMFRRLQSPDNTALDDEVYAHLVKHAGQPVDGAGLVAIVTKALAEIRKRKPDAYWPRIKMLWVIAVLIDDVEVRVDANQAIK